MPLIPLSTRTALLRLGSVLTLTLWAALLLFLLLSGQIVLSGLSDAGMTAGQATPAYLLALLPIVLVAPLALRKTFARVLARLAGGMLLIISQWWIFWLPAGLTEAGFAQRYHTLELGISPASASTQVIVMASIGWLCMARPPKGWQDYMQRLAAYLLATAACCLLGTALADAATSPLALAWFLPISALVLAAWKVRLPARILWAQAELRSFVLLQSLLATSWLLVHRFGSALPDTVNAFGAQLLLR